MIFGVGCFINVNFRLEILSTSGLFFEFFAKVTKQFPLKKFDDE